ncbi:MAG: electron transport complex subunit RsxG [Gammaproteobacteria bacterium]|nr:MAG: electron transport complex subunit RsxG [Gammaproteobacteria bacterium]
MTNLSPSSEQSKTSTAKASTAKTSTAKSSLRNGIILALFALVSSGLTAITWILTKDQIESEKELALLRAISELVPAQRYANEPYRDCVLLRDEQLLGSSDPQQAWRLRDVNGKAVAVLISSVAPNGYSGKINILVGHYVATASKATHLAGVRVTGHKETPGLGDKIEVRKSNWILQFADLATEDLKGDYWQVKKDGGQFDAFTGATITPRAMLSAISNNITYFQRHEQEIFSTAANCIDSEKEQTSE